MSVKWKKKVSKKDKKRKNIEEIKKHIFYTKQLLKNDLKWFEENLKILTKEVSWQQKSMMKKRK